MNPPPGMDPWKNHGGVMAKLMHGSPKARDVREGHALSPGARVRSALLLVDTEDRVLYATPGSADLGIFAGRSSLPVPLDALPQGVVELVRQVRTDCQPIAAFPLNWQPRADGPEVALEVDLLPLCGVPGRQGAVSIAIRQRLEVAAEASASQGPVVLERPELLSEVGHEIKNSLVAIKTFVELLLERDPKAEMARVVRDGVDRISASVSRLLSVSNPQLTLQTVRVHPVIHSLAEIVRSQVGARTVQFTFDLQAPSDQIRAEPRQLEQAILNLMMNGLESMGNGGELRVSTEELRVVLGRDPDPVPALVISVADTGCGIPPENIHHLFDEFFTTKKAGTGLGLPITRRILVAHGGRVEVRSVPGQGSTFQLLFPLCLPD